MEITLIELVVGIAMTFVGALVQASIGFGFAVISIPVLALVDSDMVPVPQLLVSFPLAGLMLRREREHVDLAGIRWIVLGRLIGGLGSIPLLVWLTGRSLDLAIGLIVLGLTVASWSSYTPRVERGTQVAGGALSGATGLLASMGGPPLAILYRNAAGSRLRSSLAAVFMIGLTLSLGIRIATREIRMQDVWIALGILPGLLAGYAVGSRLAGHVDRRGVRPYVLGGSMAASLGLIVKSLL